MRIACGLANLFYVLRARSKRIFDEHEESILFGSKFIINVFMFKIIFNRTSSRRSASVRDRFPMAKLATFFQILRNFQLIAIVV